MRKHVAYLALVVVALLTAGASSTLAARGSGTINFQFNGRLLEDAGNSTSLFVDVKGGNKPALRKLLGLGRTQQFAVDSNTQYIRWAHGVPQVVDESNLVAGDPFGHSPRQPLWLFIGNLQAPAAGHHFSLSMTDGNRRALRALLGQPLAQTFTYDAHTIFVLWQGGVPHVISPSGLVVGDRISVRIRAPQASSLAQVEATAANHVGDHEPFSNVSTP
jgi:hypothetical protein